MVLSLLYLPLLAAVAEAQFGWGCPPEGPKLPRPTGLVGSKFIDRAIQNMTIQINSALNGTTKAGWHVGNTTFSIGLVTWDSKKPIWEYHHLGANNNNGTTKLTGDSRYRTYQARVKGGNP